MKLTWIVIEDMERIGDFKTEYTKVKGGWLVRTQCYYYKYEENSCTQTYGLGYGMGGLTFIPDPTHINPPEPL